MQITLDQLLQARDNRYAKQVALTQAWPDRTLVCLTVVLPGPVKRDARSLRVATAAVPAVREALSPTYEELRDLPTGYEGYFLVDLPLLEAKRRCIELENTHPYGRLMDLDVLEPVATPLSTPASAPTSAAPTAGAPAPTAPSAGAPAQTAGATATTAGATATTAPSAGAAAPAGAPSVPVAVIPVSRERVGEPPRRCLLCDRPARECMRAHTHTPADISAAIDRLLGL